MGKKLNQKWKPNDDLRLPSFRQDRFRLPSDIIGDEGDKGDDGDDSDEGDGGYNMAILVMQRLLPGPTLR